MTTETETARTTATTRTELVQRLAEWIEDAERFEDGLPRPRLLRPPRDDYEGH